MKNRILFLLIYYFPIFSFAQDDNLQFRFSGFADTYHAVRSREPYNFMSSRSRLRTELDITKGKSYMFASLNSVYNSLVESEPKIELREAFFQYTTNNWDFKVGKQIVIWGVADGLRITDIISPMDYSEFLARDYDDIRIPVNAFRLMYIKPNYNFELVFVPVSEFFVLPVKEENPWSITHSFETPYQVDMDNTPAQNLKNSEFGSRFSFYLSRIDFSVSALHTWNKMPVFNYGYSQNGDTLLLDENYSRMDMLGIDFSLPVSKFVIRGEVAQYFRELQEINNNRFIKKNTTNILLGVDWYAGNDWTLMAQYYHKLINNYEKSMTNDKNTAYTTLSISKKIFRSTLNLESYSYVDLINKASFTRFSCDYSVTDQIHFMAGYDWFNGDNGMFSYYKDNSEYWVKAKFSF
ncbi:hypothetical protein GM418_29115 [Maribellus comscasis]|uniref:Porin n=1 Tax=Maribellus comscasis TaxID=2681766 RepID=A0A6I6K7G7_9BACT|nr:DUF1302 family protein [Maribellus comscasis]QGY47583.1 hypothetical protein GM418_29115 [Maribellus comscasis]